MSGMVCACVACVCCVRGTCNSVPAGPLRAEQESSLCLPQPPIPIPEPVHPFRPCLAGGLWCCCWTSCPGCRTGIASTAWCRPSSRCSCPPSPSPRTPSRARSRRSKSSSPRSAGIRVWEGSGEWEAWRAWEEGRAEEALRARPATLPRQPTPVKIRAKTSAEDMDVWLDGLTGLGELDAHGGVLLRAILEVGSKSYTHMLTLLERYAGPLSVRAKAAGKQVRRGGETCACGLGPGRGRRDACDRHVSGSGDDVCESPAERNRSSFPCLPLGTEGLAYPCASVHEAPRHAPRPQGRRWFQPVAWFGGSAPWPNPSPQPDPNPFPRPAPGGRRRR